MVGLIASLATLFVAVAIYLLTRGPRIRRQGQALRRPPNTLPLVGNGLLFLQARHKLFSWFEKCEQRFGFETFEISVPSLPPAVVINDPENLRAVLQNEHTFEKGDFFKLRSWDLFGNGIVNADGHLWRVQRKAGLNFLNSPNLQALTDVVLPFHLQSTISHLRASTEDVADLEPVFLELTTQIMGQMAYNMDMHADDPFFRSFELASAATGRRVQNPLWQITERLPSSQVHEAILKVKRFGNAIVAGAVHAREAKHQDGHQEARSAAAVSGSLINSLLDAIPDHELVADAALNFLSAGRDTTAQALTWTFYLLMRHPQVVRRLRDEVAEALGRESGADDGRELKSHGTPFFRPATMPYTMAVFYEALRLYPPVPVELKQCTATTLLPDGTHLPEGTLVVWCIWAMNRSTLIWGEDARSFSPERWMEEGELITRSAYEFPVFNGGRRTCLGKAMAEHIAITVIAKLIWLFDFEALDHKERVSRNSLTLPMDGGLPCRVKSRVNPTSQAPI